MFSYREETGAIELTRGDTAYLEVYAVDAEGREVLLSDFADVIMTVREDYDSEILFQIPAHKAVIKICPEHTAPLEFGSYKYDIQTTISNGDVVTFGPHKLKIRKEVTF